MSDDYQLLREGAGARWLDRDMVEVRGPGAIAFLQGQCSQDVSRLAVGDSAWSWVLQPQGKVEALVRITRVADDAMVLDTDAGWGDALIARLNRFKLRVKADIVALDWRCLAVRGPGSAALPQGATPDGGAAVDATWPGLAGVDIIGPDPAVPAHIAMVDPAAFEVARIEAGTPRMGAELTEKTIPAETGLIDRTVSFTKGCYTGQELVARIDSRGGKVPKRLCGIVLSQLAPPGAAVVVAGKSVGTLTSVAARPAGDGAVALAYIGRDITPPVAAEVTWAEGAAAADIVTLPLVP